MNLDLNTTAIVITDPQMDVLASDGVLAELLHAQVQKRNVVSNLKRLRDAGEEAGVPVLYSPLVRSDKHASVPPMNAPIYQMMHKSGAMQEGAGGAFIPELAPTAKTVVAQPRQGMMAFGTTDLDQLLRVRNAKTLVMAGMILNLCLESNIRGAVDRGYEVILVSDATATVSDEAHEGTLSSLQLIAQQTVTTDDVLAVLAKSSAA